MREVSREGEGEGRGGERVEGRGKYCERSGREGGRGTVQL